MRAVINRQAGPDNCQSVDSVLRGVEGTRSRLRMHCHSDDCDAAAPGIINLIARALAVTSRSMSSHSP